MLRYAAAVAMALALSASPLYAQSPIFTVTTGTANVHAGPSTASPVVGTIARGKTLDVTRELGSWVRIAWPAAPTGNGYLHVAWGRLAQRNAAAEAAGAPVAESTRVPAVEATRTTSEPASSLPQAEEQPATSFVPSRIDQRAEIAATQMSPQTRTPLPRTSVSPVTIPSHIVGIGGRMETTASGLAASGRLWAADALGIQVEFGRSTQIAMDTFGPRVRTTTIGSSVVYSAPELVGDAVLVRPYFGGGMNFYRSTLSLTSGVASAADKGVGYQVLGGGEFTWAGVPTLAVSVDLRREWAPAFFPGFDASGLGVGLSAHWYVK